MWENTWNIYFGKIFLAFTFSDITFNLGSPRNPTREFHTSASFYLTEANTCEQNGL